jgi:hypothetical protein
MNKGQLILLALVAVVVLFLASTLVSPILIVCEDTTEDASIDMAATFSLGGLDWIYPGSSMDAEGHTLHNVHMNNPQDPYGAARDIMTYSYGITPHLVVRVTSDAAQAIFGGSIVDDIRSHDSYNGYAGNDKVSGTMSRGDAIDTAMAENGFNVLQVPVQILIGNINFFIV